MIAQTKKIGDIEVTALSDGRLATSLDVVLGMDRAEAARLVGTTTSDVLSRRFDVGLELSHTTGAAVLLKGVPTIVSASIGITPSQPGRRPPDPE